MKDLSVIITVYNGARYLGQLIESILCLRYITYEIIVVDDGSTDDSREIVERYNNSAIYYFYKENGGVVSARNYGLSKATGKLLLFADQDDKIDAKNIEKICRQALTSHTEIAFFSTERFDDKGSTSSCDTVYQNMLLDKPKIEDILLRKLITRKDKGESVISYVGHLWAAVFSREFISSNKIQFRVYMSIEDDLLFVLDALDKASIVSLHTETGYYWRTNPFSATFSGRYIEDFLAKMIPYYEYRTNILLSHDICSKEEISQYFTGMRQEQILNIYNNEGLPANKRWIRSYRAIKQFVSQKKYSEAMRKQAECPLAERSQLEMKLLFHKQIFLLMCFKRLQNRKRMIAGKIRRLLFR